jgi:flagellar motor switch/type III secretory pathway protein FliN
MKRLSIVKIAALAMPLMLASCGSKKKALEKQQEQTASVAVSQEKMEQADYLQKVSENTKTTSKFVTSKVKFSVEMGSQDITLTGNLKMKRDDVIRLQLMAFGFVEAARIEFTKEYVLIMDRINKQYLMAPYIQVDFLRNSGLNFHSLQALFWNELFQPNRTELTQEDMKKFNVSTDNGDAIITMDADNMSYSWLASEADGHIKMANIIYKPRLESEGYSQLNWDYQDFQMLDKKKFPTSMNIAVNTANKEVKVGIKLNYLGNDSDWETRTEVSNKYREVKIDDILKRFMSL